ncbi:DUF3558 domain-containing protein [Rhodococcus triatomae]|uniref:DUF3558 domain-containing protein n=1 Tax=Rhodococcus triatomae TaxID=300028 RepID=UPI0009326341|nr:DUF3558 domain-containing protein [Rhodococcus triatomae]
MASTCAAVLVSGCSAGGQEGNSPFASPSSTSEIRKPRLTDLSARPDVIFDPCMDIPDDALRAAGLEPSTRSFEDVSSSDRTFLICAYRPGPRGMYVNIGSSNSTYDEYVAKESESELHEYDIDGRRAVTKHVGSRGGNCILTVETSYGTLGVTRDLFDSELPREQSCDGIDDMARIFLSHLPEGA